MKPYRLKLGANVMIPVIPDERRGEITESIGHVSTAVVFSIGRFFWIPARGPLGRALAGMTDTTRFRGKFHTSGAVGRRGDRIDLEN